MLFGETLSDELKSHGTSTFHPKVFLLTPHHYVIFSDVDYKS